MSIRNLDLIFRPQSVAVVGASEREGTVGHTVLANLRTGGYQGRIFPVNPKRATVQDIEAFPKVADLPQAPDLVVVCTPAATVPDLVAEVGDIGVRGMIIISAGFREACAQGRALEQQVIDTARRYEGMRIIGPNCLGVIVPGIGLNATFAADMPDDGHVAFISQSGALCTSVLDWARQEHIGFSHFVSLGNMIDVEFADLIDYFGQSSNTRSIMMYIESLKDARQFMSAARAFARTKPIIAYKAGRFPESAAAAASHTGALAGEDDVYDAAFQRAGVERVFEISDMFHCAELLARHRHLKGEKLAIVTNAGGPGVMATDALIARRGVLARLAPETLQKLDQFMPHSWSHGNPVDVLGDAQADRFTEALKCVLDDDQVDAALVILTPQAMTDPLAVANAVAEVAAKSRKPVLASWMGGARVKPGADVLDQANVPNFASPEQAVHAFMHFVSYARNLEILYETPREVPVMFGLQLRQRRNLSSEMLARDVDLLGEIDAKRLLDAYDIPVSMPRLATDADQAVRCAREIGYPVVVKVQSKDIVHKTDVGGVVVNLRNDNDVRSAFDQIMRAAGHHRPEAEIDGVTVQRMVRREAGVELILGAKKDATFGSVLLVGMGGVTAEVHPDRALGLPPLNERLARRLLESLHAWPLLNGFRGRPRVDVDRLIEVLIRFSYVIADHPRIKEMDINPLLVTPDEVVALDARVIIDREAVEGQEHAYSHLAVRPYPEQYTRAARLKDGTPVLLRAIKPEDEPMWHEMLESCSAESIEMRFFSQIKEFSHAMATRYCCIDYDREMAIAAEIEHDGDRKLIGIGHLVADPNHDTAEYAVLVVDAWQGRGLGLLLTDYCIELARSWGLKRITAMTLPRNARMLATFDDYDFDIRREPEGDLVVASKTL